MTVRSLAGHFVTECDVEYLCEPLSSARFVDPCKRYAVLAVETMVRFSATRFGTDPAIGVSCPCNADVIASSLLSS